MNPHKLIAVGAGLALALAGTGVASGARHRPPNRATITAVQHIKVKPNRWVQDGLRWNKDVYRVRSGGTLHIVNNAADEGPHTFTVVRRNDLPRTPKQIFNCAICQKLAAAHG